MHHRIITVAIIMLCAAVASYAGTVKGILIPPKGAALSEFSLVLGPIYGQGETIPLDKKGAFNASVSDLGQTALQVRFGDEVIGATILYGLGKGTATLTLTIVPPTTRPSTAFKQTWFVDAERSFTGSRPELDLHQALVDESAVGTTAPFRLTRFPLKDATSYLMKAEQLYRFAQVSPKDEQRSVDVAYCLATLSMLPVSLERDTKWVERFLRELPDLLPADDPAWALCAYASWVLDAYADKVKGLAAYRDNVLAQHPVRDNRLLMLMVSAVEAVDRDDNDRAETLLQTMRSLAPNHPLIGMAEELVDQFD